MPKTRKQKKELVENLSKDIKGSKGVVFSTYMGLSVGDFEDLREQLRAEGAKINVAKKTLIKLALEKAGHKDIDAKGFDSGVAITVADDEVMPAKILANFAKTHENVEFYGGILEENFIDAAKVAELSKLPSKDELYAKMVGSLNAPISGFVNVLSCNLRGLLNALNAIKEAKA